jgi:hypothetical protein
LNETWPREKFTSEKILQQIGKKNSRFTHYAPKNTPTKRFSPSPDRSGCCHCCQIHPTTFKRYSKTIQPSLGKFWLEVGNDFKSFFNELLSQFFSCGIFICL